MRNFSKLAKSTALLALTGIHSMNMGCASSVETKAEQVKVMSFESADGIESQVKCSDDIDGNQDCVVHIVGLQGVTEKKLIKTIRIDNAEAWLDNNGTERVYFSLDKDHSLMPYESLDTELSKEEYWNYVCGMVRNAEDIRMIVGYFVNYDEVRHNKLLDARQVLIQRYGDCDNLSLLAKKLFDELGSRIGHDFKAKIVSVLGSTHAVCVFQDVDGIWKSIDQGAEIENISVDGKPNIYNASDQFYMHNGNKVIEVVKPEGSEFGEGSQIQLSIDENLDRNFQELIIVTKRYSDFKGDFSEFLPDEFRNYQLIQIIFENGAIEYKKGKIDQIQKWLSSGPVKLELLDVDSREVIGRVFRDTEDIAMEFIDLESGVTQQNFRDGTILWFDSQKNLIQVEDSAGNITNMQ